MSLRMDCGNVQQYMTYPMDNPNSQHILVYSLAVNQCNLVSTNMMDYHQLIYIRQSFRMAMDYMD